MAGFHAGLAAPTFPTLNGAWFPAGMWTSSPALASLVESPLAIHFTHRLLAYLEVGGALGLGVALWRTDGAPRMLRALALGLGGLALGQATLGALTVLTYVRIGWASLHQINAVLLLGVLVAVTHQLTPRRPPAPGPAA
jgi:cytochrome c oxidase assembly protein subunit 15